MSNSRLMCFSIVLVNSAAAYLLLKDLAPPFEGWYNYLSLFLGFANIGAAIGNLFYLLKD